MKGKRILMLATTDNMLYQFLKPHILDLQSYGATVDCVCSKTGFWFDELSKEFNVVDIKMKRKPLNLTNLKAYKKLVALHKQNHYDLIYCQQAVGGMLGRFLGKKFNIPVIYTAHGFFFFKGNSFVKNFVYKTAEKIMSKWTDVLITMNEEDFVASKKMKCKNCYQINGIGLDLDKYSKAEFDKAEFKRSLGLEEQDKVVLSVAEFIKRKNHKTMLKTFAKLKDENVKYLLCGTGKLQEKMKKYAQKLGIQDKVKFLGYRTDIDKIMQISNVFYHQSFHEGLTMAIIEAMHFGLPVVTSNVRGNKDLVKTQGGILTKCKDINAQLDALQTILTNDDLAKQMGKFNQTESEKYSLSIVRQQLKEIYEKNQLL